MNFKNSNFHIELARHWTHTVLAPDRIDRFAAIPFELDAAKNRQRQFNIVIDQNKNIFVQFGHKKMIIDLNTVSMFVWNAFVYFISAFPAIVICSASSVHHCNISIGRFRLKIDAAHLRATRNSPPKPTTHYLASASRDKYIRRDKYHFFARHLGKSKKQNSIQIGGNRRENENRIFIRFDRCVPCTQFLPIQFLEHRLRHDIYQNKMTQQDTVREALWYISN